MHSTGSGTRADRVELGRIARAHGLDGALLAVLHGEDTANLEAAAEVVLEGPPGSIPFQVLEITPSGQTMDGRPRVRLRLAGLTDREAAEVWKGARISIGEHQLLPLPEGEYYWRDLIGLACRLPDGTELGRIEEIWRTDSNDILVVRGPGGTRLIPALEELLVDVDPGAGHVTIDPPEGLVDPQPGGA
jgi:16S rRNA processing protein RimM